VGIEGVAGLDSVSVSRGDESGTSEGGGDVVSLIWDCDKKRRRRVGCFRIGTGNNQGGVVCGLISSSHWNFSRKSWGSGEGEVRVYSERIEGRV